MAETTARMASSIITFTSGLIKLIVGTVDVINSILKPLGAPTISLPPPPPPPPDAPGATVPGGTSQRSGNFTPRDLAMASAQYPDLAKRAAAGDANAAASLNNQAARIHAGSAGSNAKSWMNFLQTEMGASKEVAAGVVGSLRGESGTSLNPAITNRIGAFGAAQWLGPRRRQLFEFARIHGLNPYETRTQQLFFKWESEQGPERGAWKRVMAARTPEEAAYLHARYWERPSARELAESLRVRQSFGRMMYMRPEEQQPVIKSPAGESPLLSRAKQQPKIERENREFLDAAGKAFKDGMEGTNILIDLEEERRKRRRQAEQRAAAGQ
jgi:hypothetical protein